MITGTKADIIALLQKEIMPLQGFRPVLNNSTIDTALGPIKNAFPHSSFPLGAIHEFIAEGPEDMAATTGFISFLLSSLIQKKGVCIWISAHRTIFPPALRSFGLAPDKIIFIELNKDKEVLWVMEEALKCEGLAAVVCEISELNFTASRRLQLAVEQSKVTGFILRDHPRSENTTACVTRWKITPLSGTIADDMPGVGFPRWNVALLKVRNGKPGTWQVTYSAGGFIQNSAFTSIPHQQKKTG